ncbi:MAG TPA: hypothetical protein VJG48_00165 [Candidatus Paceibacterota bacterium]
MSNAKDIQEAKQRLHEGGVAYIMGNDNHFKVVRATGGSYELLDSLQQGPQGITETVADQMLDRSTGTTGVLVSKA